MAKRILECNIKTIDDKNHIRIYSIRDVDVNSIKFLADIQKEKKMIDIPKPKENITKKFKKIINKN